MKVLNTPNICQVSYHKKNNHPAFTRLDDKFVLQNIKNIEKTPSGFLKGINFHTPLSPADTFKNLKNAMNNNEDLKTLFLFRWHSVEEISEMGENLAQIKDIADIKLKRLMDMGVYSLVFETDKGKVFKVLNNDHFLGRKPAEFDLPLIKSGRHSITHYYLEEMTSHDNITDNEIKKFIKYIESLGYKMQDYLYKENPDDKISLIRKEQFGKTHDGKLYLIDPGCAIEDYSNIPKFNFFNKIKNYIKKIL